MQYFLKSNPYLTDKAKIQLLGKHAMFMSNNRFDSLDGLRAISIFAVIWHHTAPNWVSPIFRYIGSFGVSLFFAISGFLITTLLLRERERNGKIDLKAFYIRRALRVFPLYFGVLMLYVILVFIFEHNTEVGNAFFNNLKYFATYTSNFFVTLEERVIFYFSWSLATEEQYYLIWPSLLILTGTLLRASFLLMATITLCVLGLLLNSSFFSSIPFSIIFGSLIAIALHVKTSFEKLYRIIGNRWSVLILLLILVLVFSLNPIPVFLVHLTLAFILASTVINENHALANLLKLKPIVYIGSISYGMYMLHMLSKNIVSKVLGTLNFPSDDVMVFFITCLLAIMLASISFKYYESYFLRLKYKFER